MKHTLAMFACLLTAAGFTSGIARAGVVIDEQVTTTQGSTPAVTHNRQLMVQGHKEKMVSDRNVFVIDLDKGTMMLIDPNQKAYAEMPFPPHGMSMNPSQQLDLNFKKTGKASKVLDGFKGDNDDQEAGVAIVRRALQAPIRQIAENAGVEGSIVVGKVLENASPTFGFNAQTEEYVDMVKAGVIDPAKVVRTALQDAASVAGLMITTEAAIAEAPKPANGAAASAGGGMDY